MGTGNAPCAFYSINNTARRQKYFQDLGHSSWDDFHALQVSTAWTEFRDD